MATIEAPILQLDIEPISGKSILPPVPSHLIADFREGRLEISDELRKGVKDNTHLTRTPVRLFAKETPENGDDRYFWDHACQMVDLLGLYAMHLEDRGIKVPHVEIDLVLGDQTVVNEEIELLKSSDKEFVSLVHETFADDVFSSDDGYDLASYQNDLLRCFAILSLQVKRNNGFVHPLEEGFGTEI